MRRIDLLLLLVSALSLWVIAFNLFASPPAPGAIPPQDKPVDRAREIQRLRDRIADLTERTTALISEVEEARKEGSGGQPTDGESNAVTDLQPVPAAIAAAGGRLGASERAIEAAWRLESAARARKPNSVDLEDLRALGEDGFRAVVALSAGGKPATWQYRWLKELYQSGYERSLIEAASDPENSRQSFSLWLLGIADTPEVRDLLVQRLADATRPGETWHIARALGSLKEPRGAPHLDARFTAEDWSGVRADILHALGEMGGDHARRILIDHLRNDHADTLGAAIHALQKIDPAAAREEARRILARPGATFIGQTSRHALKAAAKD